MKIPPWPVSGDRELELLREVLASPQWGGFHEMVGRLEREFAAYQDARYGVGAANGTLSLEMGLEALGIGPGDEVIVPAISFISTATSVSRVGATPVFVDIEPLTYNIDPVRAALAVTSRTKAIMAVHFGGPMAQMDRLRELSDAFQIHLIEDAAHAHGTEWSGQRAGSFGAFGSFSFQNGKVMTAGEGGMAVTNDEALAERMRAIANQGRRTDGASFFHHYSLGTNYRLSGLHAAVLLAQLERLPAQIELRARNAKLLLSALADCEALEFQRAYPENNAHSNYLLVGRVTAGSRDEFVKRLQKSGVPATPYYPHTLYQNPVYQRPGSCVIHDCPAAEWTIGNSFWLPHRALMGDEETTLAVARAMREASE
jgi:dTDP-4-amino-4,6-dideoxygalactose transaminase